MIPGKLALGLSLLIALVSGCDVQTDAAKVEKVTGFFADGVSNNKPDLRKGPEQIDRSAGVLAVQRESDGQTAGLGLTSRRGHIETWSTLNGTALTLDSGIIVGTAGFGPDLFSVDVDPVRSRPPGQPMPRIHRYVDGENHLRLEASLCKMSVDHAATVVWEGRNIKVSQFDEVCAGSDNQFENLFLYSGSGRLLGSRQWIGPDMGYLLLQMPRTEQ